MKRLSFLLVVGLIVAFSASAFAGDDFVITREKAAPGERHQPLKQTDLLITSTNVIATITQPVEIYRIFVTSTAATSAIGIYDAGDYVNVSTDNPDDCVFEIYEATDGEGYYIDFGDDPIRLETAFTVMLANAYAVIHYRGQETD